MPTERASMKCPCYALTAGFPSGTPDISVSWVTAVGLGIHGRPVLEAYVLLCSQATGLGAPRAPTHPSPGQEHTPLRAQLLSQRLPFQDNIPAAWEEGGHLSLLSFHSIRRAYH